MNVLPRDKVPDTPDTLGSEAEGVKIFNRDEMALEPEAELRIGQSKPRAILLHRYNNQNFH